MSKKTVICHDTENNKFEVPAEKVSFRPSVYGILIEDGRILLSKQWDGYDFPGGGVNIDETIEEALKREFIEETGVEVEMGEIVHAETSFFHPANLEKYKEDYYNAVLMYFMVKKVGGELSIAGADESEKEYIDMPEWLDLKSLNNIKFYNAINSPGLINRIVEKR